MIKKYILFALLFGFSGASVLAHQPKNDSKVSLEEVCRTTNFYKKLSVEEKELLHKALTSKDGQLRAAVKTVCLLEQHVASQRNTATEKKDQTRLLALYQLIRDYIKSYAHKTTGEGFLIDVNGSVFIFAPSGGTNPNLSVEGGAFAPALSATAGPGQSAIIVPSGDVEIVAGSLDLPATTATQGAVTINGVPYFHAFGLTAGDNNIFLANAGNFTTVNSPNNVGIGTGALASMATNINGGNIAIGAGGLNSLQTGANNITLGIGAGGKILTGVRNIIFGGSAGNVYTSSESSNIVISNGGVLGESNTIHIGTQGTGKGQQNTCFIAGINGSTVGAGSAVFVNSNGQLGTNVPAPVSYDGFSVLSAANYRFSARLTSATQAIGMTPQTIVFDSAAVNGVGAAGALYNTSTGVFTAPVAGTYLLAAYSQVQSGLAFPDQFVLQLVVNGSSVASFYGQTTTQNALSVTVGGVSLLQLNAGDTVTCKVNDGNNNGLLMGSAAGAAVSTFSGYLVSAS